jgi:hypothetical protein
MNCCSSKISPVNNTAGSVVLAEKIYSAIWVRQMELVGKKRVYSKLQNNWSQCLAVSGLVAGFSFFVVNTQVSFLPFYNVSSSALISLFGIFMTLTFLLSIGASLSALMLAQWMEFSSDIFLEEFIRTYYMLFDVPSALLVVSLVLLMVSALISVMGLFDVLVVCVFGVATFVIVVGLVGMEIMMISSLPSRILTVKNPQADGIASDE